MTGWPVSAAILGISANGTPSWVPSGTVRDAAGTPAAWMKRRNESSAWIWSIRAGSSPSTRKVCGIPAGSAT
jgi:hypothetical protein